ncbi:MAG: hypothetical protein OES09_07685 [Gammaproteobacteria bacterium]|nr:hypothetical protein [Gammaproteobacteria bacterium]
MAMEPSLLAEQSSVLTEVAQQHLRAGLLGLVVLNDQHVITDRQGDLVSWVTPGLDLADGIPFLAGYEEMFVDAASSDKPCLILVPRQHKLDRSG